MFANSDVVGEAKPYGKTDHLISNLSERAKIRKVRRRASLDLFVYIHLCVAGELQLYTMCLGKSMSK